MEATYVLIHSPLVGPFTWALVEGELRERGIQTLAPVLADSEGGTEPYWSQQARSVSGQLQALGPESPIALIGHSGAGPRLPAIRQEVTQPVAAYIFVDAGLPPPDGESQLGDMETHEPEVAAQLRALLDAGERFPAWRDGDLARVIPNASLRQGVLAELQPRALDYFEEPLPVPEGWPDAPCGYLLFSPAYAHAAETARESGWPTHELPGGHFHMLVDPAGVADAIIELVNKGLVASETAW